MTAITTFLPVIFLCSRIYYLADTENTSTHGFTGKRPKQKSLYFKASRKPESSCPQRGFREQPVPRPGRVTWPALGRGDAGEPQGSGRRAEGERPRAAPSPGSRAGEAPSPRPPRKRRREMPTSGKPAAECGGGDTEWKAKWRRRQWPGAKGRARSPRPSRRAALARGSPPASLPALPHPGYLGSLGGVPAASAPALRPAAAVQEPRTPLQVGPGLAWRVGRTVSFGAGVGGAVAAGAHAHPRWRGSRGCRGPRAGPARCGPDLAGCRDLS